jgi:histidine triad (HIT) family protein
MSFFLSLARSSFVRPLIGWVFAHASFVLPVERLHETKALLAFYHPRPGYPLHVVLAPKKAIAALTDLTPADDHWLCDLLRTAHVTAKELDLAKSGYKLIVNGGAYQQVPQLHFHLIAGIRPAEDQESIFQDQSHTP